MLREDLHVETTQYLDVAIENTKKEKKAYKIIQDIFPIDLVFKIENVDFRKENVTQVA